MPGMLCAIRGGPSSQYTVDHAATLAAQEGLPLTFLYIIDLAFLSRSASSQVGLVTREMTQMAEFILLQAQLRAQSVGVDAEGTIRRGTVQEEILACCRDMAADILILGKPAEAHGENIFTTAWLESFSQRVKAECGTRVIVVKGKESLLTPGSMIEES